MKTNICKLFFVSIIIFSVLIQIGCKKESGEIHIAVVGSEFNKAVNLFFDEVNEQGGINGKKIISDYFDDQNDPKLALEKAIRISEQDQAIAVIGHYYSTCSVKAGPVYKKHGIPAITPGSAQADVTPNNEWYFRTAITSAFQGRFAANYAKVILKQNTASIIYNEDGFAHYTEILQKSSGPEIKHKWRFGKETENPFKKIVEELSLLPEEDRGIIFIATYIEEGHRLIKTIRDMGIRNPIFGIGSFGSEKFFQMFDKYPEEIRKPGYYTGDIYVMSPLLFDTAGMQAQEFRRKYRKKYEEEPNWVDAFAYDTAMLLHQAIKETGITGEAHSVKEDRKKIRDYLAGLDSGNSTEGLNGLNYFDENGDSVGKQISAGIYRNGNVISASGQLRPVQRPELIPDMEEEIEKKRIVLMGGNYLYETDIVYIGVELKKISNINMMDSSCMLDFYICFRYQGEFDVRNIEFVNASEPIRLGYSEATAENQPDAGNQGTAELVRKETIGNMTSLVYRVSARFKNDFNSAGSGYYVGFRFRHRDLIQNNLVYVTDFLGMGLEDERSFSEKMKKAGVIDSGEGWITDHALFFQDIIEEITMGDLKYLEFPIKSLEYSQFNFRVLLKSSSGLRRRTPGVMASYLAIFCFAALVFFIICGNKLFRHRSKFIWFVKLIFAFSLLLSAESALINRVLQDFDIRYRTLTVLGFDILYWLTTALFLHLALQPFIWTPMEQRSGRPLPGVFRQLPVYLIYFTAGYGIIVFVLGLDISKLMATSGVMAMAIGLLVKDNIANYFASISIFQGHELRIGHWVKIGNLEEGKVQEITRMTTRIMTRGGSLLSIPNSVVLDSSINNYSQPTDVYELDFLVETVPGYSPARITSLLERAVLSAECVLRDPGPVVVFEGQGDSSAKHSVKFSVRDYGEKSRHLAAVWKAVWIHLEKAGIELATSDNPSH